MPPVSAPGPRFNFAQHLLTRSSAHPNRLAYIDDQGTLSYGALSERSRRLAAPLRTAGVRREERVLLLIHDCNDWPVCFLGAIHASAVPVAVNTLLCADDYAFMLAHSRAQAVMVSAALLPVLRTALATGGHQVTTVIVVRPTVDSGPGMVVLDDFIAEHEPLAETAPTCPDDPGQWLYLSGSAVRPKGTLHSQANACWMAELYAVPVLGPRTTSAIRPPSYSSPTGWVIR
jgi:benzoate-CoA ligase